MQCNTVLLSGGLSIGSSLKVALASSNLARPVTVGLDASNCDTILGVMGASSLRIDNQCFDETMSLDSIRRGLLGIGVSVSSVGWVWRPTMLRCRIRANGLDSVLDVTRVSRAVTSFAHYIERDRNECAIQYRHLYKPTDLAVMEGHLLYEGQALASVGQSIQALSKLQRLTYDGDRIYGLFQLVGDSSRMALLEVSHSHHKITSISIKPLSSESESTL